MNFPHNFVSFIVSFLKSPLCRNVVLPSKVTYYCPVKSFSHLLGRFASFFVNLHDSTLSLLRCEFSLKIGNLVRFISGESVEFLASQGLSLLVGAKSYLSLPIISARFSKPALQLT